MSRINSKAKRGFYIAVGCPNCGGRLELEENFFVLTCHHCDSVLRIRMPDIPPAYFVKKRVTKREVRFNIDRYLKENNQPLTGSDILYKQVYYPYWKIDAIILKTRNRIEEIEEEIISNSSYGPYSRYGASSNRTIKSKRTDISLAPYSVTVQAGSAHAGVPATLGMRTEYLKVEPFAQESIDSDFEVLPITMSLIEARRRLEKSVQNVGRIETADFGRNRTEVFRPIGSIVYFPFYIVESYGGGSLRRWVVDGVSGRVVIIQDNHLQNTPEETAEPVIPEFGQLTIEEHRCGNCGEDLPEKQSYIYICKNCSQLIVVEPHPLFLPKLEVTAVPGAPSDKMIPFWRLTLSGNTLQELGTALGNSAPVNTLVIPAFRLRKFESVYKLARRITPAIAQIDMEELFEPDDRFEPVEIGPTEALIMAEVVAAREKMTVSSSLTIKGFADDIKELSIFYVPFHPEHYFYVDSILGAITFEKSLK